VQSNWYWSINDRALPSFTIADRRRIRAATLSTFLRKRGSCDLCLRTPSAAHRVPRLSAPIDSPRSFARLVGLIDRELTDYVSLVLAKGFIHEAVHR
jgi:hypothetical protein